MNLLRKINKDLPVGKKLVAKRLPASTAAIFPGDILTFKYGGETVMCLVVANQRTKIGLFISSKFNVLVSCFKIGGKSPTTLNLILDALYKNRVLASYQVLNQSTYTGMMALLGKDSYRTYMLNSMQGLRKVTVNG